MSPANFTSGWLGNAQPAWHNQGVVTEGTLPAREAFETANALFTVEKRELEFPLVNDNPQGISPFRFTQPTGYYGLVRTDTQDLLGIVSKQYEIVQNESLLRMAEFIREEVDMDTVVVLSDGGKVCFTATLRGASQDIVPGDTVKRRIVGFLGHDGKTGCGAMFTNVRVVCTNTLAAAMSTATAKVSIRHMAGANENFDQLIHSIDTARETFTNEVEIFRHFADTPIEQGDFRELLERVYASEIPEGKQIDDLRKYPKLRRAYTGGLGQREFAPYTMWSAVNAITEVETSTQIGTRAQQRRQFAKANFGTGLTTSKRAVMEALSMCESI
jgi:phage/plasmid-like protein (TIGR03299 family)